MTLLRSGEARGPRCAVRVFRRGRSLACRWGEAASSSEAVGAYGCIPDCSMGSGRASNGPHRWSGCLKAGGKEGNQH